MPTKWRDHLLKWSSLLAIECVCVCEWNMVDHQMDLDGESGPCD